MCVCLMVFISTRHVYTPGPAPSHCTFTVHSGEEDLWMLSELVRFGKPFFSNRPFQFLQPSRGTSRTEGWSQRSRRTAGIQAEGKPKRKLACRKAHSQETQDNKPSVVCLFLSYYMCVQKCVWLHRLLFLPSGLIDVIFHQPVSPGASLDACECVCVYVCVTGVAALLFKLSPPCDRPYHPTGDRWQKHMA